MTTQFQLRRGTTAEHATFTGAVGEITYDSTLKTARVHDGSTSSGFQIARADVSNVSNPQFSGTSSLKLPSGTTAQRPSVSNGMIRYNSTLGNIESAVASSFQGMGFINQVQHTVVTTTASYTAGGNDQWVAITPMTVSITPTSTSSKIMIIFRLEGESGLASPWDQMWSVKRGSTYVNLGATAGSRVVGTGAIYDSFAYYNGQDQSSTPTGVEMGTVMDSPSTTSQVTYVVNLRSANGTMSYYLNRTVSDVDTADSYERFTSEILAMEVIA